MRTTGALCRRHELKAPRRFARVDGAPKLARGRERLVKRRAL